MAMPRIEGGWWVTPGPLGPTTHLAHVFLNGSVLMHCGQSNNVEQLRPRLPNDTIMCARCADAFMQGEPTP